jgi:trehalose 6-phosphate phosphatase
MHDRAGIFLDFDGTLSEIVARPDLAVALPGVADVLTSLRDRYPLVAVVSGRPSRTVRDLLPVPGLEVFGLYGLSRAEERDGPSRMGAALHDVMRVVAGVPRAWVEDKGASLAVHWREAPDPERAGAVLTPELAAVARRHGLSVLPGKMVLELSAYPVPGKGAVVLRESRSRGLRGCLYAGDDVADLDAFAALEELAAGGMHTVKVAMRSPEAPAGLLERADVVVGGPADLLAILERL